jgi:hypothetical protein
VYVLVVVNPETVIGEEELVPVNCAPLEESVATATYDVIAEPPTLDGAVKGTDTDVPDATLTVPMVGASGFFNGS